MVSAFIFYITFIFDDSQEAVFDDEELEALANKAEQPEHTDSVTESTELTKEVMNVETASFSSIFRKRYVKCLLSAICLGIGHQASGTNVITMYATMSFESFFEGNAYSSVYCNLIVDCVNVLSAFIPIFLVEKAGRKTLEFVGFAGVDVALLVLTCIFNLMD